MARQQFQFGGAIRRRMGSAASLERPGTMPILKPVPARPAGRWPGGARPMSPVPVRPSSPTNGSTNPPPTQTGHEVQPPKPTPTGPNNEDPNYDNPVVSNSSNGITSGGRVRRSVLDPNKPNLGAIRRRMMKVSRANM